MKKVKRVTSKKKSGPNYKNYALLTFGGVILVLATVYGLSNLFGSSDTSTYEGEVVIDLYAMSLCPYGVQAENSIIPVVKDFSFAPAQTAR